MSADANARGAGEPVRRAGQALLARVTAAMNEAHWADLADLAERLGDARYVFVTGAGRSGLVARAFGMRLMHAGLRAYIPGETITPAAGAGDLLVALSCTGETGFTGYMARRAHDHGASITVVTSEPNSALARQADRVVHLPVEAETIVTRAAVFEHTASLCLDAVFSLLSERLRIDEETYRRRHANLE